MKELIVILFACYALTGLTQEQENCRCVMTETDSISQAARLTNLNKIGFRRDYLREQLCDDMAWQRTLIQRTLSKTTLPGDVNHCLFAMERDGDFVMINYFLMDESQITAIAADLEKEGSRLLTAKAPIRYEVIQKENYLIVITAEDPDEVELKSVVDAMGKE